MSLKASLANHFSCEQLKQKYFSSSDSVESRRWHLLWKVSCGWTIKNSALAVGISYSYAKKIIKQYNDFGENALLNGHKKPKPYSGGKKPLLTDKQFQKLIEQLESKPSDGGVWTGPKVARWIENETGKQKVWNQRGWDYLKKCKYSWLRPRPKHQKGDPVKQQKFKQNFVKKVKAFEHKDPQTQVELWFFDEHRIGLKPILKKVWAKKGKRPKAIVNHRYEWLYVYGFVKPKTGETLWYLIPRVNTKWLNLVYETFAVEANVGQTRILLVEDNAGQHKSKLSKVPAGIEIEYLPPYSPELQPAERLWSLVDEPLVNQCFDSIEEIEEILVDRCNYLREKMQPEIKNLTNYHWLNWDQFIGGCKKRIQYKNTTDG